MKDNTIKYCACMEEIKERIKLISDILDNKLTIGKEAFDTEIVCLQLRKILELIAFSSLTANVTCYAKVHSNYKQHWKADKLLKAIEKIHPDFYPRPVKMDVSNEQNRKHLSPITNEYLSTNDFINLYDLCCKVLHTRNPFRPDSNIINFGISIKEWVVKINYLLKEHYIQFVDNKEKCFVQMCSPKDGKVHVFRLSPISKKTGV